MWILAVVSLLNDAASEMIAPLLPIFLTLTLGAGPAVVGLIEGLADAASATLKLWSGRLVDRGVGARGLVIGGYFVANLARPLVGLAASWPQVLALRFTDRIGKGLRTAPRDVLLAGSVPAVLRGRAFGLHRSFDHFGAVLGPLAAAGLLALDVPLRAVFLVAGLIGAAVVATAWFGLPRDPRTDAASRAGAASAAAPWMPWRTLDARVRALLVAVAVLAAAAVPEALIVLRASEEGLAVVMVPILWAAVHAAKSAVAWRAGVVVDRIGAVRALAIGWPLRIAALLALAWFDGSLAAIAAGFVAYGAALAATEPAERALIAEFVPGPQRGTAYGWYHLLAGLGALPGAAAIGLLWQWAGAPAAIVTAAGVSAAALVVAAAIGRRTR